jgi:hypothetical protein
VLFRSTFYITGVQLEKGSTATSFDYRPYGTELALCQRYYWKNISVDAFSTLAVGIVDGTSGILVCAKYPVTMRSAPTINYSNLRVTDGSAAPAITSISSSRNNYENMAVYFIASAAGLTVGRGAMLQANNSTTSFIDASSEL